MLMRKSFTSAVRFIPIPTDFSFSRRGEKRRTVRKEPHTEEGREVLPSEREMKGGGNFCKGKEDVSRMVMAGRKKTDCGEGK